MSSVTVLNDEVAAYIELHGDPTRTKTHGPEYTVLYYEGDDDGQVRPASGSDDDPCDPGSVGGSEGDLE
jgi:hypothetical protein